MPITSHPRKERNMKFSINPAIAAVAAPPIAEAAGWLDPAAPPEAVINLCQAVPSYPPPPEMQDEIARAAHDDGVSIYAPIPGIAPLRAALAAHMTADYAGRIAPEEVCITAGCNQAFCVALMAIAQAGDNVVIPSPWYFNHDMWLKMLGVEARAIPALPLPSPEDAAKRIDARTRAIILCTPNNPTGAIYPPAVIARFFALCQARGIALILDETYKDFRPEAAAPHGLFAMPDWQDTLIQLYSFSKVFALTGYRVGSLIAGKAAIGEIEKIMDCVAIAAPHIAQRAALFGLTSLAGWKREKTQLMAGRVAALKSAFAASDTRYELASAGTYFAYVRHPFDEPSKSVAQRLARRHDLLCLPGSMFGPGQENYLRLAFANIDASRMAEAVARLKASEG
jgi:aspartate/methionine/tyrosine aminotransferase